MFERITDIFLVQILAPILPMLLAQTISDGADWWSETLDVFTVYVLLRWFL